MVLNGKFGRYIDPQTGEPVDEQFGLFRVRGDGRLTYTEQGLQRYTKAFARNGINIHEIKTHQQHEAAYETAIYDILDIHLGDSEAEQICREALFGDPHLALQMSLKMLRDMVARGEPLSPEQQESLDRHSKS